MIPDGDGAGLLNPAVGNDFGSTPTFSAAITTTPVSRCFCIIVRSKLKGIALTYPDFIEVEAHPTWATMCQSRSPIFKVHPNEAVANSAVSNKMFETSVAKYQLIDDKWVKVFEYNPRHCQCGNIKARHLPFNHPFRGRLIDTPLDELLCWNCYNDTKTMYYQKDEG